MEERVTKNFSRKIGFEKSGEIFSVTVCVENVSPDFPMGIAKPYLDMIYADIMKTIIFQEAYWQTL